MELFFNYKQLQAIVNKSNAAKVNKAQVPFRNAISGNANLLHLNK